MSPDAAHHPSPPAARRLLLRPPAQNQTVPNKVLLLPFPTPVAAPATWSGARSPLHLPRAAGEGKWGLRAVTSAPPGPSAPALSALHRPLLRPGWGRAGPGRGFGGEARVGSFRPRRELGSDLPAPLSPAPHPHWLDRGGVCGSWRTAGPVEAPRTVPASLGNWQLVFLKTLFVPQQVREGGVRVRTFFYRPRSGGARR